MKNLRILTIMLLFSFSFNVLIGQETITTTGGEASGSGGSESYTVGQLVYTTHTGTTGNSTAQGVQQAFEISVVTGIPGTESINLLLSVYPNPASDFLTLSIDASTPHGMTLSIRSLCFQLYDMHGKLLKSKNITADKTDINTNDLTPGTYFLKVTDNKKEIKSFKIIKN